MYQVVGIEAVDYEKNGKHISGIRLHCSYERGNTEGVAVESLWVKPDLAADVRVGDTVKPLYNRFGRVEEIAICE